MSITAGDFYAIHELPDCQGDITDFTIETVKTASGTNADYTRAELLLAG